MKAFILGFRGGEYGIFVPQWGVDADTATADQLQLYVSNKIDQILLNGVGTPGQTVPLGITGYVPMVLIYTITNTVIGAPLGLVRPFPNVWQSGGGTAASVTQSSMTLSGGSPLVVYLVFNRASP
jgi:hypothetical protein